MPRNRVQPKVPKKTAAKKGAKKKSNMGAPGVPRTRTAGMTSDVNLSETSKNICKNFREIRVQAKLTQEAFANSIGVNLPYIKAVEQGRFAPADEVIAITARLYKRSVDWIFGMD